MIPELEIEKKEFELMEKEFLLVSINLIQKDLSYLIPINIMDSYSRKIHISCIEDSNMFTYLESLLKRLNRPLEDSNLFFLMNCPNDESLEKIKNLTTDAGIYTKRLFNHNEIFERDKIGEDLFSQIALLFKDDNMNEYKKKYGEGDLSLAIELLNYTATFTKIFTYEVFNKIFTLDTFDIKAFMNFDLGCVKFLNLFDCIEKPINGFNVNSITRFARTTIINGNLTYKKESVFSVLNHCSTKCGERLLRQWLLKPLQDEQKINERLDLIQGMNTKPDFNTDLRDTYLSQLDDIQRVNVVLIRHKNKEKDNANKNDDDAEDFTKLKIEYCGELVRSMTLLRDLNNFLKTYDGEFKDLFRENFSIKLEKYISELDKLEELLTKIIIYDEQIKEFMINPDIHSKISELEEFIPDINDVLNGIVGSSVNMTQTKDEKMEENTEEKNTEEERIPQDQLNNKLEEEMDVENNNLDESKTLNSNNNLNSINSLNINQDETKSMATTETEKKKPPNPQNDVLNRVIDIIISYQTSIDNLTGVISYLDVISSLSFMITNSKKKLIRPKLLQPKSKIILENSRHLLLEYLNIGQGKNESEVIPNDFTMTPGEDDFHLITGIENSGKSIYLKQIGICVLLAHIGCYVPADKAEIPLMDQIFGKVLEDDKQMKGVSTYLNEMIKLYSYLKYSTDNSLLLIDEKGKRNSSLDEIAITAGFVQFICQEVKTYCLFVKKLLYRIFN